MPDPHVTASGERFARDMRRIREAHGISIDDVHRKTMISGHIIESFEQDGLFEHPTFNRVYLRSFVRSYATAVGIDADRALEELGRALEGNYANELAVEYLDEVEDATSMPSEGETPDAPQSDASASSSPSEPAASEPSEPTPDSAEEEESEEEELPESSQQGIWIGIGIVIAILIAWVLIGEGRNPDTDAASSATAADTAQADTAQTDTLAATPEPEIALGDTMYFTVIAQDNLRPIRIQRDADIRRPYWIEIGRVGVFPAQRQIIMESELNNIRLLLNGYEYPLDRGIASGRLVITRDSARTFLDTTDATPHIPIVPADTIHIGS